MEHAWLMLLVPTGAEALLLGLSLGVWRRLRALRPSGVYQLTVGAIIVDAAGQAWQLWQRLGQPAGLSWLVHIAFCYLILYVLYRLGELQACSPRQRLSPASIPEQILALEEGG